MTAIKDSIHDHIPVGPIAADLLDTRPVQRLRHIKQLATVRLVYPSANHTRFEHSLGVYYLACRALERFDIDPDRAAHVRAAALLHDIGHGPYGHQTESVIMRHTGQHHDEVGWLLEDGRLATVLTDHGLEPERVAALIRGEGALGQLVSGALDVDRMDYLVRDAHHTGVPYGTIDHGRLIGELGFDNETLVLGEGNVQPAESLMLARTLMNGVVYRHHVSRIAGAMLDRASERLLEAGTDVETFRRMADHELLMALREDVRDLGERLEYRDLFKRAVWIGFEAVPSRVIDMEYATVREIERTLAERVGAAPHEVILDIPSRPSIKESRTRVMENGIPKRLEEVSELVRALRAAERSRWRLGVYTPQEYTDEVAAAAVDRLGLPDAGHPH